MLIMVAAAANITISFEPAPAIKAGAITCRLTREFANGSTAEVVYDWRSEDIIEARRGEPIARDIAVWVERLADLTSPADLELAE